MADVSDRDSRDATRIVDQLLADEGNPERFELDSDIAIIDLELDTDSFVSDLDLAERTGNGVLAMQIGGDGGRIPISIASLVGWASPSREYLDGRRSRRFDRFGPDLYYEYERLLRNRSRVDGLSVISPDEARKSFRANATRFLATRIAAVRKWRDGMISEDAKWGAPTILNLRRFRGGPRISTHGCNFTVSTSSNGLRVFWSGAYYLSRHFFSGPTSPVTSVLQAGTYVFGVDGGAYGSHIEWDVNALVSLPGNPFVHLLF